MKSLVACALFASLASVGHSATLIQTQSYSFVPNGNQVLTFNKFNPALGTLNSITVSVVLNKTGGRFEIDNDSESSGTINLTHSVVSWPPKSGQ